METLLRNIYLYNANIINNFEIFYQNVLDLIEEVYGPNLYMQRRFGHFSTLKKNNNKINLTLVIKSYVQQRLSTIQQKLGVTLSKGGKSHVTTSLYWI